MKKIELHRKQEKVTGAFFIAASTTAIIGASLYDPVLKNTVFLPTISHNSIQISLGACFELLLAFSNLGTGIMLYPRLKKYSESWGLGYALFRLLEVVFILIGVTSMLSIVKISQEASGLSGPELFSLQVVANLLKTMYSWAFILGPHFMLGINTFIYSSIFYKSRIVPQQLAAVGMLGAVLIWIAAVLEIFGFITPFSTQLLLLALPIAVYEMVLAGWLITKGFTPNAYEII